MFRKLAPALVLPLLVVAACATEADDGAIQVRTGAAAAASLRAAPDAAADAGTAKFRMAMEMSFGGQDLSILTTGAYDTDNERMSMEMDMGSLFDELAGISGDTVPAGLGEPTRIVVDGSTVYLQSPLLALGGGRDGWVSMSPDELSTSSPGAGLGSYDPSKLLESLRGVAGEPEVVGTEEIDGVQTTHYRATMDLADAVAKAPESERARLQAQLDQLDGAEVPVDVWIDGDGLPRRMRMDMGGLASSMGSTDGAAVMTMDFYDYGVPVDIQVPSPDDVTPLAGAFGLGAGEGS